MSISKKSTLLGPVSASRLLTIAPFVVSASLHAAALLWQAQQPGPLILSPHNSPANPPQVSVRFQKRPAPTEVIKEIVEELVPVESIEEFPLVTHEEILKPLEESFEHDFVDDAPTSYSPTPEYPRMARVRGLEGFVRLKIGINGLGQPVIVELLEGSGYDILDQAAIRGLKRWRFNPTNGLAELSYWTEKVIEFQLR